MLRHLVMLKKKPETTEETVREIMSRLEALQGQIPGLLSVCCYRNLPSDRLVAYTFLLDMTMENIEALNVYMTHPAHVAVNTWMSPFLENRAVIDYEE